MISARVALGMEFISWLESVSDTLLLRKCASRRLRDADYYSFTVFI